MSIRSGKTRTFTVSFPHELADQVERLAADEQRTVSELFREAFRTYRTQRSLAALDRLRASARAQGNKGYGPEDVYRLIHETRVKHTTEKSHPAAA